MALTKVSTDGVKDDAITSGKIPANAVGASELADNAVDTNAIANNAVTAGKTSGVQTTINNNANNRVITGSGTANTLEGESNLTWDGNNLELTGTAPSVTFIDTDADDYKIHNTQGLFKITDTTASSDRFVINDNGTSYFTSNLQVGATTTSPAATICAKGTFVSILAEGTNDTTNALVASIDVKAPFYRKIGFRIKDGNNNEDLFMGRPYGTSDTNATFVMNFHGTERFRFHADGTGLSFNGDTAAANALDDYEEGTWTPTGSGFTVSNVYSARYTKVGRMVHLSAYIQVAAGSGTSVQPEVLGLPFATHSGNTYSYGSGRVGSAGSNTLSQNNIVWQVQSGQSKAKLYVNDGGVNESMISGQHMIFSVVYEAA